MEKPELVPVVTAEKLGQQISFMCKWDGNAITEAFLAALTDANFHSFAAKVEKIWEGEQ